MAIDSLSGAQSSPGVTKSNQTQSSAQILNQPQTQPQIKKETSNLEKIAEEINSSRENNQTKNIPEKLEENKGVPSRIALDNAIVVEKNKENQQIEKVKSSEKKSENETPQTKVAEAVASVNDYIQNLRNRILEFSIDGESSRMVVRVIDMDTRKTIRQIPPEEMLRIAENVGKDKGWLLEQKA